MDRFGKIRRHHRKERLQISKIVKFESDLLKAYNYTAPQNSRNCTYVCVVVVGRGGGHKLVPSHTNVCKFSQLCRATSLLASKDLSLSNSAILLFLRLSVSGRRLLRMARMDMDWGLKKLAQRYNSESIGKLSSFNFQWTKTLYQNNLNNIAFFFYTF